jgi:hypothetical protein
MLAVAVQVPHILVRLVQVVVLNVWVLMAAAVQVIQAQLITRLAQVLVQVTQGVKAQHLTTVKQVVAAVFKAQALQAQRVAQVAQVYRYQHLRVEQLRQRLV